MIDRRAMMTGGAAAWAWPGMAAPRTAFGGPGFAAAVAGLERDARGRLGVAILDTGTSARFARAGDDRFPMCSTFKFVLAAAILHQIDRGPERPDRAIAVTAGDIVVHSPFCEDRVGGHATVDELCAAIMTSSDNGAANLLLPAVGGPPGVTRFMRMQGDAVSRLDRTEPTLNEGRPGDPRDTTTPLAMLGLLRRLTQGRALSARSRARLIGWLVANATGDRRLRAGLPAGWRAGDRTGAGGQNSDNDIAILWPPGRAPLLVTSYLADSRLDYPATSLIHARLGTLIAAAVG